MAQSLTKGGGGGGGAGGGFEGFVSLLGGLGGGGAGSSDNILTVLVGLAKSFFAMQVKKTIYSQHKIKTNHSQYLALLFL